MGLFGKRKVVDSELDIPPAPPPVKVTEEVVSAPAKPTELPELPTFPDIPAPPGEGLPTFGERLQKEERLPPISASFEKKAAPPPPGVPMPTGAPPPPEEEVPPPPKMMPEVPEAPEAPKIAGEGPPEMPSFEAVEEEIGEEERVRVPAKGPIFIRADDYKDILNELNVVRNMAKRSSEIFTGISASAEQEYERWRLCLEDVERKMLYVDRSLFGKG